MFPVKALGGIRRDTAAVEPCGLDGDRRWMVIDRSARFVTQRTHPRLATVRVSETAAGVRLARPGRSPVDVARPGPDAPTLDVVVWRDVVPAKLAANDASEFLSELLGMPGRLVFMSDVRSRMRDLRAGIGPVSFADGYPVLLASQASLDDLNARLTASVPMDRFRPNLVVDGAEPWEEDGWRRIRIGAALFAVAVSCERCVVTIVDPVSGRRDGQEPLRTLATFRRDGSGSVTFGQNLVPLSTDTIGVGDPIEVLERGPPNVDLAEPSSVA